MFNYLTGPHMFVRLKLSLLVSNVNGQHRRTNRWWLVNAVAVSTIYKCAYSVLTTCKSQSYGTEHFMNYLIECSVDNYFLKYQ